MKNCLFPQIVQTAKVTQKRTANIIGFDVVGLQTGAREIQIVSLSRAVEEGSQTALERIRILKHIHLTAENITSVRMGLSV